MPFYLMFPTWSFLILSTFDQDKKFVSMWAGLLWVITILPEISVTNPEQHLESARIPYTNYSVFVVTVFFFFVCISPDEILYAS